MKKILYSLLPALLTVFCLAYGPVAFGHSNGAPSGYTGSPGDGHSCTSCHGGSASPVTGYITTNIPGTGYVAGNNYTITVSFTGSGGKGFEVSPQNAAGSQLGTLAPGSGSKLVGGTKYCTHSSKISGSTATWAFTWTAPAAGTGNVTFYGAFAITEATTKTEAVTVSENAAQPLAVVASANPSTILAGATSQLTATATGGSSNYTYSWTSNPAGYTSTQQNPVVTPSGTTTYTVQVSDGSGTASANTTVTVIPANLQVAASANPSTVTQGQSSQLNALASGGSGSYSYSWVSNPAGFTSTSQSPVVTPAVTTQYTCTVNDGYQNSSNSTTVTVTASTLAVNVTATPNSLCSGGTTQLNAAASGGSGNYTYNWNSVPAGFTSTLPNPTATPAVTTKYFAHVNDGTNTVVDSVNVTVQPAPAAFAGNDTVICLPVTQILLSGTASNASSVLWTTSGDGTFSSASSLQTTYFPGTLDKSTGHVNLTLTANGTAPCANAVSVRHITLDPCNGIPTAGNAELKFSFWPNPTTGKITLSVNMPGPATVIIRVSDLTGSLRYREQFEMQDPSLSRTLDLQNLPSGLYLVKIECGNTVSVQKLVIL